MLASLLNWVNPSSWTLDISGDPDEPKLASMLLAEKARVYCERCTRSSTKSRPLELVAQLTDDKKILDDLGLVDKQIACVRLVVLKNDAAAAVRFALQVNDKLVRWRPSGLVSVENIAEDEASQEAVLCVDLHSNGAIYADQIAVPLVTHVIKWNSSMLYDPVTCNEWDFVQGAMTAMVCKCPSSSYLENFLAVIRKSPERNQMCMGDERVFKTHRDLDEAIKEDYSHRANYPHMRCLLEGFDVAFRMRGQLADATCPFGDITSIAPRCKTIPPMDTAALDTLFTRA